MDQNIYRYIVLSAILIFAAIFVKVFLTSRLESRRRRERALLNGGESVLEPMKPPLFDAYLAPTTQIPQAETDRWDEIMPLAASTVSTESPIVSKGGPDGQTNAGRLRVSVVVSMPAPSFNAPDPSGSGEEQPEMPYIELGVTDISVNLQPGAAQ